MTRRLKILVDADGVMADFTSAYLNVLADITGRYHSSSEVTSWEFKECVASEDEDKAVWARIRETPGLVRNLAPIWGLKSALAELRQLGDVVCVTSPVWGTTWAEERYHWLAEHGDFGRRDIVFASDKSHVHGDVLIDDHVKNLAEWFHEHGQRRGYPLLVDQPYNRRDDRFGRVLTLMGAAAHLRRVGVTK